MAGPWENYAPQTAPASAGEGPWTAYQASAPQPPETASARALRALGFVDNVVRQVANGLTFGFMDEGAARMRSLTEGVPYEQAVTEERQRDADFRRENPVTAGVAQFAGAVASPVNRVLPFARGQAASLPGAIGRGMVTGAAGGALAGYGEAEGGAAQQLASTATGAGIGAAAGGLVPAAIAGGAALARGARNAIMGPSSTEAERILLRDLGRDGVSPAELAARSRAATAAGRPEAIADLGGENVRQVAQVVGRTPGPGMQMAGDMLRQRGGQAQGERLAQEVRRAVSGDDFRETFAQLTEQRARAAAPLYAEAYAAQMPRDLRLQRFLNDPDVREGVRRGLADARREALALDQPFDPAQFGVRITQGRGPDGRALEDFQLIDGQMPTRLFDAAQRGLRELAEGARGPNGTATSASRRVEELRHALLARMDELNPSFARARAAYAGPSQSMDAMNMGRRLFTDGVDAAEFTARDIARLSPSEREFFRTGVARGLLDRVGSAVDNAEQTRLNRLFFTPQVRERLRAAFDSDEEFGRFASSLRAEMNMAATNRAVAPGGGSPTMPMGDRRLDMRAPPSGPVQGALLNPNAEPMGGASLLQAGAQGGLSAPWFRMAQRVGEARRENAYRHNVAQLGPMLFATDPAARQQVADNLLIRASRDAALRNLLAPYAAGATRSIPAAAVLTAPGP